MRQQLVDVAVLVRWQSPEHVFEIGVGVVAVKLGRLDQAGDGSGALSCQQCAGKEPVFSSRCPGPDLLLIVVVVMVSGIPIPRPLGRGSLSVRPEVSKGLIASLPFDTSGRTVKVNTSQGRINRQAPSL